MIKYKLKDYIEKLEAENLILEKSNIDGILDRDVQLLSYNSNELAENTLFVCKGVNFKDEYLEQAIAKGAFAYIADKKFNVDVPYVIVNDIYVALSILSELYFNSPASYLNVIGITGTKGKSTTAYYIKAILDEYMKAQNKNETAIISSIDTIDGVIREESHLTTPESYELNRHFRNAVDSKMENLVMEVSSQALKMGRVHNLKLDIGVFLNISEDHISPIEHPDLEDYFTSKLKIFSHSNVACINLDCDMADRVKERALKDSKKVVTFSSKDASADIYAYDIKKEEFDTVFRVKTKTYDKEFMLTMPRTI